MIHHISRLLLSALLAGGVVACSSDNVIEGTLNAGVLSLDIKVDDSITEAGVDDHVISSGYTPAEGSISLSMTSATGSYSHTWTDASQFPHDSYYLSGLYTLEARSGILAYEGFDQPAFHGHTDVRIEEGHKTDAVLTLSLANTFVTVEYTDEAVALFESVTALLHTTGGLYHTYAPEETRRLCLTPGTMQLLLDITLTDGRNVTFPACTLESTEPSMLYAFTVDCTETPQGPEVTVSMADNTYATTLSEAFINAAAPETLASWGSDSRLELPEGNSPEAPYDITISSGTPLASVTLSTLSRSLIEQGMPMEIDLLHTTPEQRSLLENIGLKYQLDAAGGMVSLGTLLSNLVYLDEASSLSTFSLIAVGTDGKTSIPASLVVHTVPVEIEVVKTYPVTMGIDRAHIEVKCDASGFMEHVEIETAAPGADVWNKVQPLEVKSLDNGLYSIAFDVAEGSAPVPTRILYCDEVRSTFEMSRTMPPFTIEVDPYATMAAVKIVTADESLLETITSRARIYINGDEAPIYIDFPERGILTVIGLFPSTTYEFKATMMTGVSEPDFTPSVSVVTESTPQLPNADFEDRTEGVRYKDLPAGGRYAQTVVEIFNWQHHTSIEQEVPKQWANTNAKTFAMASDNHNTWYMQPSVALTRELVFSQSFAAELTSVAFDPHGQPIPDYTQTGTPYLDYSPIVPDIAYRAAGKLFLGQYSFDPATMQESYDEGIEWTSRPSSLNGYYCYYPASADRSDCGLVTIEVLGRDYNGDEIVIASGSRRLTLALNYTAFSVPLTYAYFGVKATRIKVMLSSSATYGTLEYESANIVTVPDPVTATSTGGKLWIDNLTLAY